MSLEGRKRHKPHLEKKEEKEEKSRKRIRLKDHLESAVRVA